MWVDFVRGTITSPGVGYEVAKLYQKEERLSIENKNFTYR